MSQQTEISFEKRKSSMLTSAKEFRLFKWMEKHAEEFRGTFNDEVAKIATEDLEFAVSPANIKHARGVLGLPTPREARRETRGRTAEQILAYEVIRILKELEFPVPADLLDINDGTFSDRG